MKPAMPPHPLVRRVPKRLSILVLAAAAAWAACGAVLADAVDEAVRAEMFRAHVPGCVVGIQQRGRIVKIVECGTANLELSMPVTAETVFELGGMTMEFTTAAVLLLHHEGKLSLDDPVSKYVSGIPASWPEITVYQALTHSTGLKPFSALDGFEIYHQFDQAGLLKKLENLGSDFEPGRKASFSTTGFLLLGFVIEKASGQNWLDFCRERLFRPLEMNATGDRDPFRIIPFRAAGYRRSADGSHLNRSHMLTDMRASGALASSLGDLMRWGDFYFTDKILPESVRSMIWEPVRLKDGQTGNYGLGCRFISTPHGKAVGFSGLTLGFGGYHRYYPDLELSVVVLCNLDEQGIVIRTADAAVQAFLQEQ